MSKFLTAILCCIFLAAEARAQTRPPRDYEDAGACPFECCTYRSWAVNEDTAFYRTRSTKSPRLFSARKGERVTGLTGVVITVEPGRAVVRRAATYGGGAGGRKVRVRPGDVLYLLHYSGEGVYKFWFRGRVYEDSIDRPLATEGSHGGGINRPYAELLSEPKTVWWVKVRDGRGRVGWSRQTEHFGDMDSCA